MEGREEADAKREERRPSGLKWSRGSGGPAVRVSPAAAFLILLSPPRINLKLHSSGRLSPPRSRRNAQSTSAGFKSLTADESGESPALVGDN